MMTDKQYPPNTKMPKLNKFKLVLKEEKQRRVTPSAYTQEMLWTTEERLDKTNVVHVPRILEQLDMSKTTHQKMSSVSRDQPLFQPYPSELIFQNFTPGQTHTLHLHLLNKDKVPRHVRLEPQHSEFFHVVGQKESGVKVVPGMTAAFAVSFTPLENKDYHHTLGFVTERERFEVSVRAIGPRAILDFRDEFHLPVCPVKDSTEKTYLVRNIGKSQAKFALHTQRPFSVTPSSGTLDVGGSMQVTVDFNPSTIGDHIQDLTLHYHTGEDVCISLCGACKELNVHLDSDSVWLKRTYISKSTVRTFSLTNTTESVLKYCWTLWPSLQEEALSLLRESSVLQQEEEEEEGKQMPFLCESDLTMVHHPPLLSRALQERRCRAEQDYHLVLSNSCMTVEPAEGEIWPNMTKEFNINFKPEEAKLYQETIYCDVTGRESRLPLTIMGEGMGPQLQLSYNLMDLNNIFIGDKDCYEVLLSNTGPIDAPFRLSSPDTTFGQCLSVRPEEGVVPSGARQIVEVTFSSSILGAFSENLLLTVTGQPEPLTLTFRGHVIGPTIEFRVSDLNFDDVGFGFPRTLICSLFNTSYVPVTFALRVLGDGLGSQSVPWQKQLSNMSGNNWRVSAARDLHERPVEFTISPAAGTVPPDSNVNIEVTLCANTVKRYRLALAVDVEGVGEEILTLPINARCVVPDIVVEPPVLDFQRCFIDHPYEQKVCLINSSNVPACYSVLDQECEDSPSLLCGSSSPRGLIGPHSSEEIPVSLLAKAVGKLHHTLRITVWGSLKPPLEVFLSCIGQGPVVHVQNRQLDFGRIEVLTDRTKALYLSNQSPIPANFSARMGCTKSFWHAEPSEGEIPPKSQLELKVVAHLKDTIRCEDSLEVSIQHSHPQTVLLSATGTGTTIVSDRPFAPSLDLGTHLSPGSCQYYFKLTNHGQRTHRLYWRTDSLLPSAQSHKGGNVSGHITLPPISGPRKKDILGCGSVLSSRRERPVFSLSPSRVELFPGGTVDMVLTGSSDSPMVVQERLMCRAIVDSLNFNGHIMSVDVTCRFVPTVLRISPNEVNFYIKKVPGESLVPLYEKLILTNVSSLSLSMELSLVEPFSLCEVPGAHSSATTKSLDLGDRKQGELWICFNPAFCLDRVSRVMDEFLEVHYQGHRQPERVKLHAEVHFPNLRFSSTTVDFGCAVTFTETRRQICMTNCSLLPVAFRWVFLGRSGADQQRSTQSIAPVFDILPTYGHLQPGDKQLVTFFFYGHDNVRREVVAQCRVEDGPTYNINLRGEAAVISYSLDSTHVDFGLQPFNHEGEAKVTLRNTGKVGFQFSIIDPQRADEEDDEGGGQKKTLEEPEQQPDAWQKIDYRQKEKDQGVSPGRPMVIPALGYIDAGAEQCLRVLYIPDVPEVFEKRIQLKVAHLPPQDITLIGEGVFPRISLNLPQVLLGESCVDEVQPARAALKAAGIREELTHGIATGGRATEVKCTPTDDEALLHVDIERMLVKENAPAVTGSRLDLRGTQDSSRKGQTLSKFLLPEHVLDFGYVIPGQVLSHVVDVTNPGSLTVSFHANLKPLSGTGFSAEFQRVKSLHCGETQTFTVQFDPQKANLKMGETSVVMPIQVTRGPVVKVRLCAVVTVPAVSVSTDSLQFDTVQLGMCQMKTFQLFNHESVPCCWSIAEEVKPFPKVDRSLPLYLRKKVLHQQRPSPAVFEMIPSSGTLPPGERVNVQIKFSPAEAHVYSRRLEVRVDESTKQVFLTAQGQGEEPQLEFCPAVLELGPCLPVSTDAEAQVTIKNPCPFPIEFYSLELDTQYLEEEKILRLMQGFDENQKLLLPPRAPGEGLPKELLEFYMEYCSQLKDHEEREGLDGEGVGIADTHEEENKSRQSDGPLPDSNENKIHTLPVKPVELFMSEMTKVGTSGSLGQLEMTPVSRAIARHMCIDLSPEGLAARNRRGIAIIVYGAPLTGGSSTAAALARHYTGTCLNVDAVVTDGLMNGTSAVSLTARQLYAEKKNVVEAAVAETSEPGPAADPTSSDTVDVPTKTKAPLETENTNLALFLGENMSILRNLLPEQLLVKILEERFQISDCYRGIVIDGLESAYTCSAASTLQVVLKALNNRKHIYAVTLSDSYAALKARERAQRETEEALQKEEADREEQWLQELDDEEYDALPQEVKERIHQRYLEKHKQRKLRELERIAKEQEGMRQQEEMKRSREEELKRSKKGVKKDTKEVSNRKGLLEGKQSSHALRRSSCNNSKESLADARGQQNSNEVHQSKEADASQKQTEETTAFDAESPQPKDKLEREKNTETAETKRLRREKECKKNKMDGKREVSGEKSLPNGGKESTIARDGLLMSLCDTSKEPRVEANEDGSKLHHREAAHSQKKTDKAEACKAETPQPADKLEGETSRVDELQAEFSVYERSQEQVEHILQHWDRVQGLLLVPLPTDEAPTVREDNTADKRTPVGKRSKVMSSVPNQMAAPVPADQTGDKGAPQDIIPHIVINVKGKDGPSATELLKGSTLPPVDQVLDDVGLGPSGPPIPPPTTFSIVPFPKNRQQPELASDRFTFLDPSRLDEQGEKTKDEEEDVDALVVKKDETSATPSKSRGKGSVKESPVAKVQDKKSREGQRSKRRTPLLVSSRSDCTSPAQQDPQQVASELKRNQSLTTYRWVVPANGEVVLRIWFYSDSPGSFEQIFNFELLGSQRRYQLICRGICTYPSICKDHRTLFALSKKVPQLKDGIQKTYVIKPGYFEFGPVLCGKTRDRYKENRYPENTERLVIHNNSGLKAEVQFCFQHDTQATTYLLDPPAMTLEPDQKQELTVWTYPTKQGQMKDSIVCNIKDNPELVIIDLSCWGVWPELKLESKHLNFERILLHRRSSRSVTLLNKTALPVSWRLQGVEELGDEFSVAQDQGIISSNSSFPLSLNFRARRPLHVKKILRLEVSDVGKILGIVHTELIHVTAEAYDIALDISPDGCLDFGTIKVFEESKLSLKLKNQGKYQIAYKFTIQQTKPTQPDLDSIFMVLPKRGSLMPHDKTTTVQILFKPNTEVLLTEQPVLSCEVIEPNIGDGGETVAIISLNVSVEAVFCRYKITPACGINFGPLVYGSKKSQSFTIENSGVFRTHFTICRMITHPAPLERPGGPSKKMPQDSQSGRATDASNKMRRESLQKEPRSTQNHLTMGVFSVSPCSGTLQPGSQQLVTVNCAAEQVGRWNQGVLIDISDRDPSDQPTGIPYSLLADVCKPGIVLDMASIFEEHHLCRHSSHLSSEQFCSAEGIYVQEENKFIFNKVLVGQTAQARFKLTNNSKVPCVLSLAIRYTGAKTSRNMEVFDLPATTLSIPSQSHAFAVLTFTPQTMQLYTAAFEATMEAASRPRMTPTFKSKMLEFDLIGEGNMPCVRVVRPALRNSGGSPVLQFGRVLVGHRRTLHLVLRNDGNIPAQVQVEMLDNHGVFSLKATPGNTCSSIHSAQLEDTTDSEHQSAHKAALRLNVNEQVEFEVIFCSEKPLSVKAKMTLQVEDNQYINTIIPVTGEAYQDIFSICNIRSRQDIDQEDEEGGNYEVLSFGHCQVDCPCQESFTMTNHSSSQVMRFEWPPAGPHVCFSPQVGHLHAGCSMVVTATFCSSQPVTLAMEPMRGQVCQVEFQLPVDQVPCWDDRQKTVQWLSSSMQDLGATQQREKKKVLKTDPEPCCSVVEGSQREVELRISAVCDYVKFSCNTDSIHFKDTMLYQTRLQQMQIVNCGNVVLEFSFKVHMDPSENTVNHNHGDETCSSRPGSRSAEVSAGARPASAMSLLMGDPKVPPFSIEPHKGAIAPGAMQDFTICFSPLEVAQFSGRLSCSMPNLQDGDQPPCISLGGRSLLPYCHFELEDSDYINGIHCNSELSGPLDPNTRVIQFNAVGLSSSLTRRFSVVNPTSHAYSFKWKCKDTAHSSFRCLTPCGTIQPGKKVEVCFEYVAKQMDVLESLWSFVIDTLSLSVPFLCVGVAREPLVYLDRPHLDLGVQLVGRKVEQTVDLVNGEEEPFQFSVMPSSLLFEDQQSRLIVRPMTGEVAARDRLPLSVRFTPCQEGYVSFRLVLSVKGKSEPVALTVKADCFSMNASVQVEMPDGGLREVNPHQDTLDFGKVEISEKSILNFLVTNLARFSLEVSFEVTGPSELLQVLEVKPVNASADAGKQLQSSLLFCSRSVCDLRDVRLSIKVKHGPTFTFDIKGSAVAPSMDFSFTKYNFGKCFLHCPGMMPASQTLVISNTGERDVSVQCQFKNTSYLEIDFQVDVLSPGAVKEIPVNFYPQKESRYHETLTFILNSGVKKEVDILGQGIKMKLEVEDPRQRKVKLGSVMWGQKVEKQVALVNRSPLDLSFSLLLNTNALLDPRDLSLSPAGYVSLKAGGSCNVEIHFSPLRPIAPFTAELQAEFAGWRHPLLTIQGCCQGVDVQLDQERLAFGAVVRHCQARKRIVMMNSGKNGASFQWKTEHFPPELSITPAKGYISSCSEVPFEVTFAPVDLSDDSPYESLSCSVEGSTSPVRLIVTGSCIQASTSEEVVNFVCPVRGVHTQTLHVFNPSNQHCSIRPVLEGQQWSAEPSVTLQPLKSQTYKITYRPLTMTADRKKHLGSVFFSFPDGAGMLYCLQGTAEPPKAEDTIVIQLPAKTQHTQLLPVHNWLSRQQRFRVLIEILKPDKPDATVSLKGPENVDVPALDKRDYTMSFCAYREGQYSAKVTFRNVTSGEFLFFLVTFNVTSPGVLSTVELVTTVRQTASATVQVENPLTTETCLTTECKCPDISAPPQHTVPPQSKGSVSFEYQPLLAGESTARLSLWSNDLGHFHHDLLLRALPPPPEKTVHFNTCLGSSHSAPVKFINYSRVKTEYSCQADCLDFIVDKSISASPGFQAGSEASVEVCFEPHQLGEVRGQLSLSSGSGGEYIFPLHGSCLPPKDQGPFSIRAGRSITIPFKNVFLQTTTFSFQVDRPCFTVKGVDTILSKRTQNIAISFEAPPGGSAGPWFGKLNISSQCSEGHSQPVSWVYYLKGFS